ncbi:MAG: DUF6522 family protein [Steroidobacteraceae bacterium]
MNAIQLADGAIDIEASLIAPDLGLDPARVLDSMRSGALTATCERGVNDDAGRYRITFFHRNRRLRLIIDESGHILERSAARLHRRVAPPCAAEPT